MTTEEAGTGVLGARHMAWKEARRADRHFESESETEKLRHQFEAVGSAIAYLSDCSTAEAAIATAIGDDPRIEADIHELLLRGAKTIIGEHEQGVERV